MDLDRHFDFSPTRRRPNETEAASAGFYEYKTNQQKFPRLQLRTVKELMEGKGIERPTSAGRVDEVQEETRRAKGTRRVAD